MSADQEPNLEVLKRSRTAPREGDIFTLRPRGRGWLLGRMVSTDAKIGTLSDCILIYVFKLELATKPSNIPRLPVDDLLVPPMMTNKLPWSRGHFENIDNRPIEAKERFDRHVFRRTLNDKLYDENGMLVTDADKLPVGEYGLHSYRTIDDAVSRALGIPLAPG